ncbi:MAG: MBL fold metallo-hydrolase [Candidatus Omnitrophica bacterium]|nr:MBL fold metallo-hydrolase [Candidatus Omnitrophota bacterium]
MGKATVVFNHIAKDKGLKTGWGLSVLLETGKEPVLFDVGPEPEHLLSNMNTLGINPADIRTIVISHGHNDHVGALEEILRKTRKTLGVYTPVGFDKKSFDKLQPLAKSLYAVRKWKEITNGVYVFPIKGLCARENVLVIDSPRGLILFTGCAHPCIYGICKKVKNDFGKNIYAVLGGLHLEHFPVFFVRFLALLLKKLGIKLIGPTHCTGEKAKEALRQIFKEGFVSFEAGDQFEF